MTLLPKLTKDDLENYKATLEEKGIVVDSISWNGLHLRIHSGECVLTMQSNYVPKRLLIKSTKMLYLNTGSLTSNCVPGRYTLEKGFYTLTNMIELIKEANHAN